MDGREGGAVNPWQCWECWPKICRCNSMNDDTKQYLASIGARGGKAGAGKAKARTKEHARAAAKARWDKARALRQNALHELPPPCGSECNQDATGG